LVSEADPYHGGLTGIGAAHEIFERRDPVELVVDAGGRAGNEDRLQDVGVRERLAIDDADGLEMDRRVGGADHAFEHLREGAMAGAGTLADQPGFDDRDA